MKRFRMPNEYGHAWTQVATTLIFGIEDLLGFDDHLPFFLGEAIIKKAVDMRDHVESDLFGELLRFGRIAHNMLRDCSKSSSMPSLPAPETD